MGTLKNMSIDELIQGLKDAEDLAVMIRVELAVRTEEKIPGFSNAMKSLLDHKSMMERNRLPDKTLEIPSNDRD